MQLFLKAEKKKDFFLTKKKEDIFLILAQNKDSGCSKDFTSYPQSMF